MGERRRQGGIEGGTATGRKKGWSGAIGLLFLCLILFAVDAEAFEAFVSIPPQRYFVHKIGGPTLDISVLVPPGADPHVYEPKPRQMTELSRALLYFSVGIEVEKVWLKRIAATNPRLRIVRTDEGIEKRFMTDHDHRGVEGARRSRMDDHRKTLPDPHIWLSPPLVKKQAAQILLGLIAVDAPKEALYRANYRAFSAEIDALDGELRALLGDRSGAPFLVSHPSWGYFAETYGLRQIAIEKDGKEPKPADLQRLIRQARRQEIRVVFVEPQFSAKGAEMVAQEIGGAVIQVDPLAEDWAENLRQAARAFSRFLR